ncbi:hypothetical protein NC652_038900 [Populus alba x Populus x berolinensis]|nr:hypothetical protein NC652_038900 [Populus alba x Populus x berolinensis]
MSLKLKYLFVCIMGVFGLLGLGHYAFMEDLC